MKINYVDQNMLMISESVGFKANLKVQEETVHLVTIRSRGRLNICKNKYIYSIYSK